MANPTQRMREARTQAANDFADECRRAARLAALTPPEPLECPVDGRPITEDNECPKCGRRVYA